MLTVRTGQRLMGLATPGRGRHRRRPASGPAQRAADAATARRGPRAAHRRHAHRQLAALRRPEGLSAPSRRRLRARGGAPRQHPQRHRVRDRSEGQGADAWSDEKRPEERVEQIAARVPRTRPGRTARTGSARSRSLRSTGDAVPRSAAAPRRGQHVPRQHDPRHVRAEADEHGHPAQAEGQCRADPEQDLQPEERRKTEADANGQRRRRPPRRAVDGGEILERCGAGAASIRSTIPCAVRPSPDRGLDSGAARVLFFSHVML